MDNELILTDRIEIIKSVIQDNEDNFYLSFSGGKDSTILHYLIDEALPNNNIPRVFCNTGIEYLSIVKFVNSISKIDKRFIVITPNQPIKPMLEKYGYPFKSKEHSQILEIYQNSGLGSVVNKYLEREDFQCPKILKYQFTSDFNIKVSAKCCNKLKKTPFRKWEKENNKNIVITGMRKSEGGARNNIDCIVKKDNKIIKFHPLVKVNNDWINWYIKTKKIQLCELYYPPFNFERTGCKGCPFAIDIQKNLDTLSMYLPHEYKQCLFIWKPIYDEYQRLGYRLKNTLSIFEDNK